MHKSTEECEHCANEESSQEEDVSFTPEQQKMLHRMFRNTYPTKHYACRLPSESDKDFKHRKNILKQKRRARKGK